MKQHVNAFWYGLAAAVTAPTVIATVPHLPEWFQHTFALGAPFLVAYVAYLQQEDKAGK